MAEVRAVTDSPAAEALPSEVMRVAFELSPSPIVLVDCAGRVRAANGAFCKLVRMVREDVCGDPIGEYVAGLPEDLSAVAAVGEPVAAVVHKQGEGEAVRSCAVHVAQAGDELVLSVLVDAAGSQTLLDAALRRVEEQSRVQRAFLDLSRTITLGTAPNELVSICVRTFKDLMPGARVCVRLIDPETHELRSIHSDEELSAEAREGIQMREGALRRTGLSGTRIARGIVSFSKDYQPVFPGSKDGFEVPLASGDSLFGVLNVEATDGDLDVNETVVRTLANQLSVGLRNHRLYGESLYLRGFLENLLESANALIVVLDRERRIIMLNQAVLEATGFPRDEIFGQPFVEFLAPDARGRVLPLLIDAMLGEPSANIETQLVTHDGGKLPVVFSTAPFTDAEGRVGGIIAVGSDLSRVKALEGQVHHSSKLATLGQLAAGIVHELSNPLTSISVYSDYLLRRAERGTAEKNEVVRLRRIVDSAERIRGFCQDLLTYARPSEAEITTVDLNRIIEEALAFCEHVLHGADVIVTPNLRADPALIFGVRDQLHQVFVNLCTNAAHAVHDCPVTELVVSTQTVEGVVEVTVSDTGVGIEEADLAKIFEPFFSTKGEGRGTGLGLSIVRELVENHRGSLSVRSKVGTGTAFTLRFPLAK